MTRSIPVPWLRWQRFRITGVVKDPTGAPLAGLRVQAFDKDVVSDDFLGDTDTNAEGRFEIRFTDADFRDAVEARPDLYLKVFLASGELIHDTSYAIRRNASDEEYYEITLSGRIPG